MKNGLENPEDQPEGDVVLAILQSRQCLIRLMFLVQVDEANVEMVVDDGETNDHLSSIAHDEEDVEKVEVSDDKAEVQSDVKSEDNANEGEATDQDQNLLSIFVQF